MVASDGPRRITVTRPDDDRQNRALHGLTRALVNNMVVGVTKGFEKRLKIEGVGYQAAKMDAKAVELMRRVSPTASLHAPPDGVTVEVARPGRTGSSSTGPTSRRSASSRPRSGRASKPEPYKGKGVRYENESRPPQGRQVVRGGGK